VTLRDPLSPQWEDCKVCGGDHWTKDHPATHDIPEAARCSACERGDRTAHYQHVVADQRAEISAPSKP
jgi:hypothetical protein